MGLSISRLVDWTADGLKDTRDKDAKGDSSGTYLSYDIFLVLSVFGGLIALDHLYLRSPHTFLAKLAVNFTCFGAWWLYDALRAVFHSGVVKLHGISIPVVGQTDIGAGVFSKPEPSQKHHRFLVYAISLIFGGIVGADSFVVGNKMDGFIRLICFLTAILSPISIFIWVKNLIMFFTNPPGVLAQHPEFFGYPGISVKDQLIYYIPIIGELVRKYDEFEMPVLGLDAITAPLTTFWTFITSLFSPKNWQGAIGALSPSGLYGTALDESKLAAAKAGMGKPRSTETTAENNVTPGANKQNGVSKQNGASNQTVESSQSVEATPSAPPKKEVEPGNISGGGLAAVGIAAAAMPDNGLNKLHYVFIGTLVVIILGGAFLSYYRAQNDRTEQDDSPPEPGVFRSADSKRHPA
jgi:hypothetical protein